jgi:hypothetical protein
MRQRIWTRVLVTLMVALLLWWLFWAILIDEDENEVNIPETEIVE